MNFMRREKKIKIMTMCALFVAIVGMSLGFAAFSFTLNISSSAKINPSSDNFVVKFSTNETSLVVEDVIPSDVTEGLTVSNGVIVNSLAPTLKNLSAKFTEPGQFVEYTIYARNEGSYVAYLNNINFIGEKTCVGENGTSEALVKDACADIKVSVDIDGTIYEETTGITNHPLESDQGEKIVVRLSYVSGGNRADGNFSITFPDISLVYSTIDDPTMVHVPAKIVSLVSGSLDVPGSIVSVVGEQFYVIGQENDNVKLLAKYNLHVGNRVDEGNVVTPLENSTGLQSELALGSRNGVYPYIGTTDFGDGLTYYGSVVEEYVDNYKDYLISLGVNVFSARLITLDELDELGCDVELELCGGAFDWVYSTSYWIDDIKNSSGAGCFNTSVLFAGFDDITYRCINNDYELGVRPVIEIPLSEFE